MTFQLHFLLSKQKLLVFANVFGMDYSDFLNYRNNGVRNSGLKVSKNAILKKEMIMCDVLHLVHVYVRYKTYAEVQYGEAK